MYQIARSRRPAGSSRTRALRRCGSGARRRRRRGEVSSHLQTERLRDVDRPGADGRRMKRTTFLLVLGVLLSFCWAQSDTGGDEAVAEEEHVELFTTPTTKMAAGTSDFGYNLFRALASRDTSTNIFLSPISVSAALTQLSMVKTQTHYKLKPNWCSGFSHKGVYGSVGHRLYQPPEGASEAAERQLFRALRYHTLQDPQLHTTLKNLLASVKTSGKGLSMAARIYLARRELRLKQEFFGLVEQQYGVRPKALQGGAKDMKEINDWVTQETGGKVQRLLSKALPRNPGIHTVSGAYFKGKWVTRFSQNGVMENFQVDGSAPVRVSMMKQDNYPVKMGADSDLSCTVRLRAGLSEWLDNPDLEKISAQPAKLVSAYHKVVMETAPEGNLYPSTTSTASHLSYRVDRPFIYLIRDEASGALLFIAEWSTPRT
ncbi:hypothetical protein INR49_030023 [Caranx melampygus]|nr:hypothetical protein INR49_030023 [Caranx melampygus]